MGKVVSNVQSPGTLSAANVEHVLCLLAKWTAEQVMLLVGIEDLHQQMTSLLSLKLGIATWALVLALLVRLVSAAILVDALVHLRDDTGRVAGKLSAGDLKQFQNLIEQTSCHRQR